MRKALSALLLAVAVAIPAHAAQLDLFSTGVDGNGDPLFLGDVDPHYAISAVTDAVFSAPAVEPVPQPQAGGSSYGTNLPAFVVGPGYWVANGPSSNWISPSPDTNGIGGALFFYETSFDLTTLDPATARVAGSWATDDCGWMFLNGNLVAELPFGWMFLQLSGLQVAPNVPEFTANHDFELAAGFLPGVNTLTFLVWNGGGGPTGVRVEIASATADPAVEVVGIDIKPGSDPNPVNPGGNGRIPVAILASADFDPLAAVDVASLRFGLTGDEPSLAFCNTGGEDVDGDGRADLICHFFTRKTGFGGGSSAGILKGMTLAGMPLAGSDTVRIVP